MADKTKAEKAADAADKAEKAPPLAPRDQNKVLVYNKTTKELIERFPIDAREMVTTKDSEWTLEIPEGAVPTAEPGITGASVPITTRDVATEEELKALPKEDLVALAKKRGVTVTRGDGEDGEPRKEDYVAALKGDATATSKGTKGTETQDELEAMPKDELVALAKKRGITVTRSDGDDGEPLKEDYVTALLA